MGGARNAVDMNNSNLKGANTASLKAIDGNLTLQEEFQSLSSPKKNLVSNYAIEGMNLRP